MPMGRIKTITAPFLILFEFTPKTPGSAFGADTTHYSPKMNNASD
tara:strand:- start:322 stop:456 length:135 start_codon:yes stop_codon:yes gene_type:complete